MVLLCNRSSFLYRILSTAVLSVPRIVIWYQSHMCWKGMSFTTVNMKCSIAMLFRWWKMDVLWKTLEFDAKVQLLMLLLFKTFLTGSVTHLLPSSVWWLVWNFEESSRQTQEETVTLNITGAIKLKAEDRAESSVTFLKEWWTYPLHLDLARSNGVQLLPQPVRWKVAAQWWQHAHNHY